jgi:hypothetical protein
MICSTSWHLASLLQLSDGNASTALHLVIGNAMRHEVLGTRSL